MSSNDVHENALINGYDNFNHFPITSTTVLFQPNILQQKIAERYGQNDVLRDESKDGNGKLSAKDLYVFSCFNQDSTSLSFGTGRGFKIFALNSTEILELIYENGKNTDVYIAERLFSSSLVALVSLSAPRKLVISHFRKGTEICNCSYSNNILSVKLNRARLVVCLEESLIIHNICDMVVLHTIKDTPHNENGLFALSANADHCLLAYPGHVSIGELLLFDALNLSCYAMIPAHTSRLVALQFSASGDRIATASEKGTVIRVFITSNGAEALGSGTRLFAELRRGLRRTAHIYSLAFSPCGLYLALSSNTETVHVFKLDDKRQYIETETDTCRKSGQKASISVDGGSGSWLGYINSIFTNVGTSYLPRVAETLLQERAFATARHCLHGQHNIVTLAMINKTLRLLMTSSDGYLYIYGLDLVDGGDACLIKQFCLTDECVRQNQGPMISIEESSQYGAEKTNAENIPPSQSITKSDSVNQINIYTDRFKDMTQNENPSKTMVTPHVITDSEKFHEMVFSTTVCKSDVPTPNQCFLLDDDGEFPPITLNTNQKR